MAGSSVMRPRQLVALWLVLLSFCPLSSAKNLRAAAAVDSRVIENAMLKAFYNDDPSSPESAYLAELERQLKPTFEALPKNEDGNLGHAAVRYLLHRFFMQKYSWFVRGLEPGDDAAKASVSKADFSLASAPVWPSFLQGDLESMVEVHGLKGLNLRGVASLVRALEELVHQETINRLTMAYDGSSLTPEATVSSSDTWNVLREYMLLYTSGWNMTGMTHEQLQMEERKHWHTRRWTTRYMPFLERLQEELEGEEWETENAKFDDVVRIAQEVDRRFQTLNNQDCKQLKTTLLRMETRKPGRVRLSDFYNKSRESKWAFTEKIEYLRTLGALDETNASNPLVIVPNYITSMPQCLKASSLYTVCCPNECENIMSLVEGEIGAPEADPEKIAELVKEITTDTVQTRTLSETLLYRLREVASLNGGRVPLHGRLFAQWLHHAFPRECPFPHQSSTTSPLTPDEWIRESGHSDSQATEAEMTEHIQPDDTCPITGCPQGDDEDGLPWNSQEELLHHGGGAGSAIKNAESEVRQLLQGVGDEEVATRGSGTWFTATSFFVLLAIVIAVARYQLAAAHVDPKKAGVNLGLTGAFV
eukprot:TRINITY_DN18181_c0_g1_i1.p1 TRINITY_DN18181_c0_g1~~TRINITY_DN18181_c0_g1_i1.p1  ORF type:complete len:590 (+),score=145.18 TRINITY_DN18181_c0_g1_i1:88-1857(+)